MLIRNIIIPKSTRLEIELPKEYIGKKIEYLIFDLEKQEVELPAKVEEVNDEDF